MSANGNSNRGGENNEQDLEKHDNSSKQKMENYGIKKS